MGNAGVTPRLVCCTFNGQPYERLVRVLELTARRHCGHWDLQIGPVTPATHDAETGERLRSAIGKTSHVENTQKMEAWAAAVDAAPDGTGMLLIDADTFILRPLDDIWDRPFDFAYTTKVSRFPFNSGVVLLRVSSQTRAFVQRWRHENLAMLRDFEHHREWRRQYGGINQAALGRALQSGWLAELQVLELPCAEWNCEDATWRDYDPATTRIVHVKSALRLAVLGMGPALPSFQPLVHLWRRLERGG